MMSFGLVYLLYKHRLLSVDPQVDPVVDYAGVSTKQKLRNTNKSMAIQWTTVCLTPVHMLTLKVQIISFSAYRPSSTLIAC